MIVLIIMMAWIYIVLFNAITFMLWFSEVLYNTKLLNYHGWKSC